MRYEIKAQFDFLEMPHLGLALKINLLFYQKTKQNKTKLEIISHSIFHAFGPHMGWFTGSSAVIALSPCAFLSSKPGLGFMGATQRFFFV